MYYDIHCHLDYFDDPDAVVERALQAGVTRILTNGLNQATNEKILALAAKHDSVDAALGLYPTDAAAMSSQEVEDALAFIKQQKPVAIGEVGIDYHHDATKKQEMQSVFSQVLSLAESIKRPILVHSRKAEADVIDMLSSSSVTADLHCFGGSLKLAKKAVDLGCYFSIPATIVRATHFQRLVEEVPLSQLLTETDAPYLSPNEEQNEPKNVPLIVEQIASIKQLQLDECKQQLWMNAQRFLR